MGDGKRKWADYWRDICAPKLRARKAELGGRDLPERVIAYQVAQKTEKPSQRSLVAMWLHGEREPFISQFFALCDTLQIDPTEVLGLSEGKAERPKGVRVHTMEKLPVRFAQRVPGQKGKKRA